MPGKTQLSTEAIRHIASGEIGIHAAKSKYGIGEKRVLRIRQGLETAANEDAENADTQPSEPHAEKDKRPAGEQARAEAEGHGPARAETDRDNVAEETAVELQKARAKILELEAANAQIAELQRATIRKLLQANKDADQLDKDTAATLSKAKAEVEQARAEAKHAKDDAERARQEIRNLARENLAVLEERQQRIATLESQLAEAQAARPEQQQQEKQRPPKTRSRRGKRK